MHGSDSCDGCPLETTFLEILFRKLRFSWAVLSLLQHRLDVLGQNVALKVYLISNLPAAQIGVLQCVGNEGDFESFARERCHRETDAVNSDGSLFDDKAFDGVW